MILSPQPLLESLLLPASVYLFGFHVLIPYVDTGVCVLLCLSLYLTEERALQMQWEHLGARQRSTAHTRSSGTGSPCLSLLLLILLCAGTGF